MVGTVLADDDRPRPRTTSQQRHRGLPHSGDIGTLVEAGRPAGVEVGDHPPAAYAGIQRAHVQRRPQGRPVCLDQAGSDSRRQRKRDQCRCHLSGRAGIAEKEQPDQGGELTTAANGASYRYHLITSQGRVCVRTEQREDTVRVVAGATERLAQRAADRQQLGE